MEHLNFENLLRETIGLDTATVGRNTVERAVEVRMRSCGLTRKDDYWERVQASNDELQELIEAVVVPETWFFRDREAFEALGRMLEEVRADLRAAGLEPGIVSGGSTPTWFHSHELAALNEIRPGTYIFNDRNTALQGACTLDECAASVMVTVVSTAKEGQVIIDGGSKTFSSDLPSSGEPSHGHVKEAPQAVFRKMNEEHGYVDVRNVAGKMEIGRRLRVIPNHICVAMNLHEQVYGVRNGKVECTWRVEGRGKLQ